MNASTAVAPGRRLHHPSLDETLTFVETAADTDGARTLVDVDLGPGRGTPVHHHHAFAERFEVLDGTLTIHRDGERLQLGPGDVAEVPIGSVHRFVNDTDERVTFRAELTPGHAGFEQAQQLLYGLARDGGLRPDGMPRDPRVVALIVAWSDTRLVGAGPRVAGGALGALAALARRTGLERRLRDRYVSF